MQHFHLDGYSFVSVFEDWIHCEFITREKPISLWELGYMKILAPDSSLNCVPQTLWRSLFTVVDGKHLLPIMMQSRSWVSFTKNLYHVFPIPNSILRVHSRGSLQLSSSQFGQHLQRQVDRGSYARGKEILVDSSPESSETLGHEDCKEIERRRRISVANKGKKPWNKGIKHSPEIREKIKQRTIEALGDPKVRKKMSSCPRPAQSEENKAKISIAQKRLWKKRLKIRRIKEKLYLRWEESIAEAAKIGWSDQQELDWDSYEKMNEELILRQIQRAADKVRAKEIAKLRAARAAKEKEEKIAKLAQRRGEREQGAKARGEIKGKTRKWSVEEKQQLAISKDLRFRQKITKIRQKAHQKRMRQKKTGYTQVEVVSEPQPAIEKLDLEFIEKEKLRREVSLADQLRAAKISKAESTMIEALVPSSSDFSVDART